MADKEVTFQWNDAQIRRALEEATFAGLQAAGVVLRQSMQTLVSKPGPSAPGEPPGRRTSTFMKSMRVEPRRSERAVLVGTNDPRGRWLEFGVTVRAKKARYLTIPLNKKSELWTVRGRSVRSLNLQFIKTRDGKRLLLEPSKRGGFKKNGYAFALKEVVRIQPRPWLWPSYNAARAKMDTAFRAQTKAKYRQLLGVSG